ncbi:HAD family hydrolase [Streptantibioticus silvisoli]|uniref:Haloacid dehalogenase-like hydrolase n=1 Tax=Streptantibioticus silvisoli TaxID=2705255 RepID=A0ABT6VTU2_9ACTN|nr:haloacid dehalogenase-like hydrolase [Streptantibioticus silvisoli]MDI5961895.1 haloacid dehalogenase-like hydrolase [Streptantibioticus silvisoli]
MHDRKGVTVRLILWDIDHTLIDTRGIGEELSGEAFERTTGQPMLRQARVDGITEAVIFRETAKLHGLNPSRADFERFARELAERHIARLADLQRTGHALPGAGAALKSLAAMDDVAQTAVTGNVRPVAEIKLRAFGLDHHIDWPAGGYGEDADERADLVRLAMRRASTRYGTDIRQQDTVIVGDTPADVAAALDAGVPVIAVASGKFNQDELRDAGAECTLPDLADTEAFIRCVDELRGR